MPRRSIRGAPACAPAYALALLVPLAPTSSAQLGGPWTDSGPRALSVEDIETSPVNADLVIAMAPERLARSGDGGTTFTPSLASSAGFEDVAFGADGRILVASGQGITVSLDGGQTFLGTGAVSANGARVLDVEADPVDPLCIWAGLEGAEGLVRSDDGGQSWSLAGPTGLIGANVQLAIDPADGDRIVASARAGRVYLSGDGGATWTQRDYIGSSTFPTSDCVYFGSTIVIATSSGLDFSSDGGATFGIASGPWSGGPFGGGSPVVRDLEVVDAAGGTVVAVLADSGVVRSVDGGATWSPLVSTRTFAETEPRCAAVRPGGDVWIGTEIAGVIATELATGALSEVGGGSLSSAPLGSPLAVGPVAIDPNDDERLLVIATSVFTTLFGSPEGRLFLSEDGGATWSHQAAVPGLVRSVEIGADGTLWAGRRVFQTFGSGLETLVKNDGSGWFATGPPPSSLSYTSTSAIAVAPDDPSFVVALNIEPDASNLEGARVWISSDGAATWTLSDELLQTSGPIFGSEFVVRAPDLVAFEGGVAGSRRIAYSLVSESFIGGLRSRTRVSNNGGATWTSRGDSATDDLLVTAIDARGDVLHRTSRNLEFQVDRPLERSADAGFSWTPVSGSELIDGRDLAASPSEPGVVFFSDSGEVARGNATGDVEPLGLGEFIRHVAVGGTGEVLVAAAGRTGLYLKRIPLEIGDRSGCGAGVNSLGLSAQLRLEGSDSLQANDLTVVARRMPAGATVLPIFGDAAAFVPFAGGSEGTLCVGGTVGRFVNQSGMAGPDGSFSAAIDLTDLPASMGSIGAVAGDRFRFQCWYRDVIGGAQTSNFTDAVALTIQP